MYKPSFYMSLALMPKTKDPAEDMLVIANFF